VYALHWWSCRVPSECEQWVAELIDCCLAVDAAVRPTAHQLIKILAGHLGSYKEDELSLSQQSPVDDQIPDLSLNLSQGWGSLKYKFFKVSPLSSQVELSQQSHFSTQVLGRKSTDEQSSEATSRSVKAAPNVEMTARLSICGDGTNGACTSVSRGSFGSRPRGAPELHVHE
jgi:hypothetical protein